MATIGSAGIAVLGFYGKSGLTPEDRDGPAGGTFSAGELLVWTSGLLVAAAADANHLAGVAVTAGVSGASAKFIPLTSDLLLEMTLLTAGGDYVSLVTNRGLVYGFSVSSHVDYLDVSETTNGLFRVVAIPGTDYAQPGKGIIGDTNIRVHVIPVAATLTNAGS